jgi:hypothetical protein
VDVDKVDNGTHGYPDGVTTTTELCPLKGRGWPLETDVTAGAAEATLDPLPEFTEPPTADISCQEPLVPVYLYCDPVE